MTEEKIKLYLDTSIPSSYYDTSKPVRQLVTQKWFENKASFYDLYISTMAIDEIDEFSNVVKRQNIKDLILDYDMKILEMSEEAVSLAEE